MGLKCVNQIIIKRYVNIDSCRFDVNNTRSTIITLRKFYEKKISMIFRKRLGEKKQKDYFSLDIA